MLTESQRWRQIIQVATWSKVDVALDDHFDMNDTTNLPSSEPSTTKSTKPNYGLTHTLLAHTAPLSVVKFSPDGNLLASTGADGIVAIWCV
jgi:WD40 repeat protein